MKEKLYVDSRSGHTQKLVVGKLEREAITLRGTRGAAAADTTQQCPSMHNRISKKELNTNTK